jgi:hypothetical protein
VELCWQYVKIRMLLEDRFGECFLTSPRKGLGFWICGCICRGLSACLVCGGASIGKGCFLAKERDV